MTATYEKERGFTLGRRLAASRDLVFAAWTDPSQLGWFFNPEATPAGEPVDVDLRVGGAWRQRMVINDDLDYMTGGIYREITPPSKLVFLHGAVGGWPEIDPERPDDVPQVTLTFKETGHSGESTDMTLRVDFPDHLSDAEVEKLIASGMRDGWGMTIDRLVDQFAA
jgi:uncharacterized protein YndB with AHSA1/START domain